jgi:Spy/CpxP family protein refolding chaperone
MRKFAILLAIAAVAIAPSFASAKTKMMHHGMKHHGMKHHAMMHHGMMHHDMMAKKDRGLFEDMFSGK